MVKPVRVRSRTDPSQPAGSPEILINWFEDPRASSVTLQSSVGWAHLPSASQPAEDLLGIAVAVYVADRSIIREEQADGWTRHIVLEVPVGDPHRWPTSQLDTILSFLTGDRWSLHLRRGSPVPVRALGSRPFAGPESIALFSGGVDSLTGVLDLIAAGTTTALVSYFGDNPTGGLQRSIASELGSSHGVDLPSYRFRIVEASGADKAGAPWPGLRDRHSRSRSFLFLALAVLVADMFGVENLRMAENGYIAVNVPLHSGRAGSLSTRTAHPHFVQRFNDLLSSAGIEVAVDNPFLLLTKGEVSQRLLALAAPALIRRTISCAHPVGRWQGEGYRNCGYCYPCLIRRAGFRKAGSDPSRYSANPLRQVRFYADHPSAASDIRSLARSMLDPVQAGDIMATGPIPSYQLLTDLHRVRVRGFDELHSLLMGSSTRAVRQILGL